MASTPGTGGSRLTEFDAVDRPMTGPGDLARECHCVLCEPPEDQPTWDDGDIELVGHVQDFGWHVAWIEAEGTTPAWAFTVGLTHTFGHPEIAMFGLQSQVMANCLNLVGEQIRGGDPLVPDEPRDRVFAKYPAIPKSVDLSWYRDLFGYAVWFAQGPPPFLQLLWPDREGRFPWDENCGHRCRVAQPQLWIPHDEHATGH